MPQLAMCHFVNEPIPLAAFPNDFQVKENTNYNNKCLQRLFALSRQVHFRKCPGQLVLYGWRKKYRCVTNEGVSSGISGCIRLYHRVAERLDASDKIAACFLGVRPIEWTLCIHNYLVWMLSGMWCDRLFNVLSSNAGLFPYFDDAKLGIVLLGSLWGICLSEFLLKIPAVVSHR